MTKQKQLLGLVCWLLASFAASAIGALASIEAKAFYGQLTQPGWAPPPWLFGPVWTVLYALMGVAAWLVWRSEARSPKPALALFMVQLGLNALWSWLFFSWHQGLWSFVEVLALWLLILATLVAFWKRRPLAGALLLPYLLWVAFASALTFSLWQLNPQLLG
ncbi:TspO/MBR family protein [Gallaecimonas kandeliae]|uniref:TspO/MBR family protein n=1 Tax=Gallaecimonas kandeliae TaxID=3029055 RepID=UPI00300FF230